MKELKLWLRLQSILSISMLQSLRLMKTEGFVRLDLDFFQVFLELNISSKKFELPNLWCGLSARLYSYLHDPFTSYVTKKTTLLSPQFTN